MPETLRERSGGVPHVLSVVAVGATVLALGADVARGEDATAPRKITISRETTYLTEPLMEDGTPDYGAALNAKFGAGVTPENNAAVLLAPILGLELPEEVSRRMGIDPEDRSEGPRFVGGVDATSYQEYLRAAAASPGGPPPRTPMEEKALLGLFVREWGDVSDGPWPSPLGPHFAEWVSFNGPALDRIVEATARPRFWIPVEEGHAFVTGSIPSLLGYRSVARALLGRASQRLSAGEWKEAAGDALSGERLGALLGGGPSLLERLVGVGVTGISSRALPGLAVSPELDVQEAKRLVRVLEGLAPLDIEGVLETARFSSLAAFIDLSQLRSETIPQEWGERMGWNLTFEVPSGVYQVPLAAIDWDELLRLSNRVYDLADAELQSPSPDARRQARARIKEMDAWMQEQRQALEPPRLDDLLAQVSRLPEARLELTRGLFCATSLGPVSTIRATVSPNEANAQRHAGLVALALGVFRAEKGGFPRAVDALTPEYLSELPPPHAAQDGYVFQYHPGPALDTAPDLAASYAYVAVPEVQNETGVRIFCVDSTGRLAITYGYDNSPPAVQDGLCREAPELRATAAAEPAEEAVPELDLDGVRRALQEGVEWRWTYEAEALEDRRIDLRVREQDVSELARLWHEIGGLDVVLDGDVRGVVSADLHDVPWREALEGLLRQNGLRLAKRPLSKVRRIVSQKHVDATIERAASDLLAVRELGALGSAAADATPLLEAGLGHADPVRRAWSAWALALVGEGPPREEAIETLIALLGNDDEAVRRLALDRLALLGPLAQPAAGALRRMAEAPGEKPAIAEAAAATSASLETGECRFFCGTPINLGFTDARLSDLLSLYQAISGLYVAAAPGVEGRVGLFCEEMPWDETFAAVLEAHGLGYALEGMVIRVAPVRDLAGRETDAVALAAADARHVRGEDVEEDQAAAAALFRRDCDGGDLNACHQLGWMYSSGTGVPQDLGEARELFERSCAGGDGQACLSRAVTRGEGESAPEDQERAEWFLSRACELGGGELCAEVAATYKNGDGVPRDGVKAAAYYEKACEDGFGCLELGDMYYAGDGVALDRRRAVPFLVKACAAGRFEPARGCDTLGYMFNIGAGVPQDTGLAKQLLLKACRLGGGSFCSHTAQLYRDGNGAPRDLATAAEFFQEACDRRDAYACMELRRMLLDGSAVPEDASRASELLRRAVGLLEPACGAGRVADCVTLGRMYAEGDGVARDEAKAEEYRRKEVRLYEDKCARGQVDGCQELSRMYAEGDGVTRDPVRAAEYSRKRAARLEESCEGGGIPDCVALGSMYAEGEGVEHDETKAEDYRQRVARHHQEACDAGSATDCLDLGRRYAGGDGVAYDEGMAEQYLEKACGLGSARGCLEAGHLFYQADRPFDEAKDPSKAARYFDRACELGDQDGCFEAGFLAYRADNPQRDPARAAQVFRAACEQGCPPCCSYLGAMTFRGDSVAWNPAEAARYHRKACGGGQAYSCYELGKQYRNGAGVPRDPTRAAELFDQACQGGEAGACSDLGVMSAIGEGVDEDQAKAVRSYQKACESATPVLDACYSLGLKYAHGVGVAQDEVRAATLLKEACDSELPGACEALAPLRHLLD